MTFERDTSLVCKAGSVSLRVTLHWGACAPDPWVRVHCPCSLSSSPVHSFRASPVPVDGCAGAISRPTLAKLLLTFVTGTSSWLAPLCDLLPSTVPSPCPPPAREGMLRSLSHTSNGQAVSYSSKFRYLTCLGVLNPNQNFPIGEDTGVILSGFFDPHIYYYRYIVKYRSVLENIQ